MKFSFDADDIRPLVAEIVAETLQQIDADGAVLGDRLAIPEAEAARLLSMRDHQLSDERLDSRITASVTRGGKIVFAKSDLQQYLATRRWKRK